MTITLDEAVYDGLYRTIGKRQMSQFIEDLVRPYVVSEALDAGYPGEMANDSLRDASEWISALNKDMNDERGEVRRGDFRSSSWERNSKD
jgi:hypothetical protein